MSAAHYTKQGTTMTDVILHHYSTSPYSEKIRLALGAKNLAWRSVKIPNIMPKPDVTALTGGYRKTPVMQIGADVYCDTACILRELEQRFPQPSLYASPAAEPLASWADAKMFGPAVAVTFAHIADTVPQEFKDDRAKFSGRDFNTDRMKAAQPHMLDQLRAAIAMLDTLLADGRPFVLGDQVSVADLAPYHSLWFVVERGKVSIPPVAEHPRVSAWMERVKSIGHGTPSELSSTDAIEIARSGTPAATEAADGNDPAGRKPGMKVKVTPDDTGRDPVVGELVGSSAREIVIRRTDERAGTVHVHFPRLGFVVAPAG
jgi:glutathione S-transferase